MLIHHESYSTAPERKDFQTALKRLCAGDLGLFTSDAIQVMTFPAGDRLRCGYIALAGGPGEEIRHYCGAVDRVVEGDLDLIAEVVAQLLSDPAESPLRTDPNVILTAFDAPPAPDAGTNPKAITLASRFLRAIDFPAYRAAIRSREPLQDGRRLDYATLRSMGQPYRDLAVTWPWLIRHAFHPKLELAHDGECPSDYAARVFLKATKLAGGDLELRSVAAVLDRIRGLDPNDDVDALIWDAVPALAAMPREWLPAKLGPPTADEWAAALRVASETWRLARLTDRSPRSFVKSFDGSWTSYERDVVMCGGAAGWGRHPTEEFNLLTLHCGDMLSAFERQILLPSFQRIGRDPGPGPISFEMLAPDPTFVNAKGTVREMSAKLLFRDKGWRAIADLAGAWAASAEKLGELESELSVGARWPVPFEAILYDTADGHVLIKPLATPAELLSEGAEGSDPEGLVGLSHCVASLIAECAAGNSLVLSIRHAPSEGKPERLSTAQLKVSYSHGGCSWRTVQHRGHQNSPPPPLAVESLNRFLRDPRAETYAQLLAEARRPHSAIFLYDPRRPDTIERMLQSWHFALARQLRKLSPAQLAEAALELAPEPATYEPRTLNSLLTIA